MKSAKSSSTALHGAIMFNTSSCNSSPESKTTSNSTHKASLKINSAKPNITALKMMSDYYNKINKIRSNLLSVTNQEVVKRKKYFEEVSVSQSICIHQEFDVTSRDTNKLTTNGHPQESELHMSDYTASDFKIFHCSPVKLMQPDRRESSKLVIYNLFCVKRNFKIISKNSNVEAKKPFAKRLTTIALDVRSPAMKESDKINDLQLLTLMIRGNGAESPVKQDMYSNPYPTLKFHSDNNVKKNIFRDSNKERLSGKSIKSSQTLSSDIKTKVSSQLMTDMRSKEKSHKTSNILVLIPCGTKPQSNA